MSDLFGSSSSCDAMDDASLVQLGNSYEDLIKQTEAKNQICELKKFMIGASEFEILEKLIDINAPRYVIEYQMNILKSDQQRTNQQREELEKEQHPLLSCLNQQCREAMSKSNVPTKKAPAKNQKPSYQRCPNTSAPSVDKFQDRKIKSNAEYPCSFENELNLCENIQKLIDDELDDINCHKAAIAKLNEGKHCHETLKKQADPEQEITPEMAAAILHKEEKIHNILRAPREMMDAIFPDSGTVEVTQASPHKPNAVLPIQKSGHKLRVHQLQSDALLVDFISRESHKQFSLPEPNITEDGENEKEDVILGVVDSTAPNEDFESFEVIISPNSQSTRTQVQMRGSQPPKWFPGYFTTSMESGSMIPLTKPWAVLEKAWQNFRPDNIKTKKGAIVIGS